MEQGLASLGGATSGISLRQLLAYGKEKCMGAVHGLRKLSLTQRKQDFARTRLILENATKLWLFGTRPCLLRFQPHVAKWAVRQILKTAMAGQSVQYLLEISFPRMAALFGWILSNCSLGL